MRHARLIRGGLCAVIMGGLLAGCLPNPERAVISAQPQTQPVRTITGFSDALRCMDGLFQSYGVRDRLITSTYLEDRTGRLQTGTRDMLITAIARMSQNSRAFRYVDFERHGPVQAGTIDPVLAGFEVLMANNLANVELPNHYIRGSISQLDSDVQSGRVSAGITTGLIDFGGSRDIGSSTVGLDLQIAELRTRQVLPIAVANTITVSREGRGVDADARLRSPAIGLNFAMNIDRSEGSNQAVRTLIELGAIQLLGQFAKVPYWRCLQADANNPQLLAQMRDWFDAMTQSQRERTIATALANAGFATRPELAGAALRDAVARFQASRGLTATGLASFETYAALLGAEGRTPTPAAAPGPGPTLGHEPEIQPLLRVVKGDGPAVESAAVGDRLRVEITMPRTGALACFYRDGRGVMIRLLPNRFQTSDRVEGGTMISVPPPGGAFALVPRQPRSREDVRCHASAEPLPTDRVPVLAAGDLTPLPGATFESIDAALRAAGVRAGVGVAEYSVR